MTFQPIRLIKIAGFRFFCSSFFEIELKSTLMCGGLIMVLGTFNHIEENSHVTFSFHLRCHNIVVSRVENARLLFVEIARLPPNMSLSLIICRRVLEIGLE